MKIAEKNLEAYNAEIVGAMDHLASAKEEAVHVREIREKSHASEKKGEPAHGKVLVHHDLHEEAEVHEGWGKVDALTADVLYDGDRYVRAEVHWVAWAA